MNSAHPIFENILENFHAGWESGKRNADEQRKQEAYSDLTSLLKETKRILTNQEIANALFYSIDKSNLEDIKERLWDMEWSRNHQGDNYER